MSHFIVDKTIQEQTIPKTIFKKLEKVSFQKNYICCCDGIGSAMKNISPTLTFSGCKYMYHSTYNRYLTPQECLMLQGFSRNFKNVVGNVKLCNQIGNSMSVNVLKAIIHEIFLCSILQQLI
jgi:site-specific DNA-cytosine methylase